MTRIVGGAARGRPLRVPPGRGTRPTSDRTREALFSALEAQVGPLRGLRMLDLFAGTGAVGLEALSRGATGVVFVESDAGAARVLSANVAAVGLRGADVRIARVDRFLAGPPSPVDLVFADPPYAVPDDEVAALTERLTQGWLAEGALVVIERSARGADLVWPAGLEPLRFRRYGEAVLWYGRAAVPD